MFNQHLNKLLTDEEKAEFNFMELEKDDVFLDAAGNRLEAQQEKRSKSVMRPAKKMLTLKQINVQKLDASPMKGGRLDSTYIRNMANKELHGGFNDYSSNQLLDMTMDTGVGNQSRISSIPVSRESNRELGAKSRRQSVMHHHGNSIILNEAQKKKLQGRLSIRPQGVSQRELMTKADAVS